MLVNGQPCETVSIKDRGLLYGDGVFETILCDQGRPLLLAGHTQRLENGCKRLGLSAQELPSVLSDIRQVAGDDDCIVKVIVTRGLRARGYSYDKSDNTTTRIVYREEKTSFPAEFYKSGIALTQCQHALTSNPSLAGIKHLNRLDQVMARSEWDHEFQEGVMLNPKGYVLEGTMSNIFIEKNACWLTPKLDQAGVAGVMRQWIMRNAYQADMECVEEDITLEDMKQAQAMFICNSVIGIWPVNLFLGQTYVISEATQKIMQHLNQHISTLYMV